MFVPVAYGYFWFVGFKYWNHANMIFINLLCGEIKRGGPSSVISAMGGRSVSDWLKYNSFVIPSMQAKFCLRAVK